MHDNIDLRNIIRKTLNKNKESLRSFFNYGKFLHQFIDKDNPSVKDIIKVKKSFSDIKDILKEKEDVENKKHYYLTKKIQEHENNNISFFYGLFIILVIVILIIKQANR